MATLSPPRSFPLPAPVRDEDEVEDLFRELKNREEARARAAAEAEAERKREEVAQVQMRQARAAELAAVPHTFDSRGRVVVVEKPDVSKLPAAVMPMAFRVDAADVLAPVAEPARSKQRRARSTAGQQAKPARPEKPEFTDFFQPAKDLQPRAADVMELAPGAVLVSEARGRARLGGGKRGPSVSLPPGVMSRSNYQELAASGGRAAPPPPEPELFPALAPGPAPAEVRGPLVVETQHASPIAPGRDARQTTSRASSPATSPVARRETRNRARVPTLGSQGGGLPPPPLGATMGHGAEGPHYYPAKASFLPQLFPTPQAQATVPREQKVRKVDSSLDLRHLRGMSGGVISSSKSEVLRSLVR